MVNETYSRASEGPFNIQNAHANSCLHFMTNAKSRSHSMNHAKSRLHFKAKTKNRSHSQNYTKSHLQFKTKKKSRCHRAMTTQALKNYAKVAYIL